MGGRKEKRSKEIKLRFTDSEYESLLDRLPETEQVAVWLRELALNQEKQKRRKRKQPIKVDPDLIYHLGKIGNNLNQVARAVNTAKKVGLPIQTVEVLAALKSIEQYMAIVEENWSNT